ncbi:MAG: transposase [Thermoguttaceae bacterium]|nr:transposase [Thermoguttaceae bacterium]MBR4105125.1 transposase [Thermoguttaceae bacterium]
MKITKKQYKKIEPLLPKPRGNCCVDHLTVLNAVVYVAESGCVWRDLPRRYGHWNTVYRRFRRWSEDGVLAQVLEVLKNEEFIGADFSALDLESTLEKSSPRSAAAIKKRPVDGRALEKLRAPCEKVAPERPKNRSAKFERWREARRVKNASNP